MKIISFLGSPHKTGNTAAVLGWVEDELRAEGHDVERVNIIDTKLNYCNACYHCQGFPDEPGCVQDDDGPLMFTKMINADALLFASPLYMWSFAAPMKTLFDRCLCLVTGYTSNKHKSLIEGKRTGLVVTCGGPVENNADLLKKVYDRMMQFGRTNPGGELIVPFCTSPDQIDPETRTEAKIFAGRFAKA